ncbi:hypothetical protein GGTG_09002 [Gaeumannomyces tritici R3-111a-1]|uniref:Uncharacterized protein n=1 Tax=Gaeumannomyces tritici (strain R3-111a-1) TaxID=644352 RepID=J3P661_GAET3|nr:hypothetical protein GGTG_09002 [Gaeumannomyces tritici R3-111a-1]EJT72134.1 hypothetical protein GGTG_09002 [Gaeumannomyces tritici R3-111a-1]
MRPWLSAAGAGMQRVTPSMSALSTNRQAREGLVMVMEGRTIPLAYGHMDVEAEGNSLYCKPPAFSVVVLLDGDGGRVSRMVDAASLPPPATAR